MTTHVFNLASGKSAAFVASFGVFSMLVAPGTAISQTTVGESAKLVAPDGEADDNFGFAVALDGGFATISSPLDDDAAANAGAIYTFDVATGSFVGKAFADDTPANRSGAGFGASLAATGGRLVAGASRSSADGLRSGTSYLLDAAGNTLAPLTPFSLDPRFDSAGSVNGFSVGISSQYIVVGAPGDAELAPGGGSAYFYQNTPTPTLVGKILPSDPRFASNFGRAVAVSDTFAVVGAPFDDTRGSDAGAIYVFDPASGTQLNKITPIETSGGDFFGNTLAVDGELVAVGAPLTTEAGVAQAGAVYLVDGRTGSVTARLVAPAPVDAVRFGSAVALSSGRLLVGAPGGSEGKIYVYDLASLQLTTILDASDGVAGDGFGERIALDGDDVLVGAFGADPLGNLSGAAYLFALDGGNPPPPPPPPGPSAPTLVLSSSSGGTAGSVRFADEDLIAFENGSFSMYFDGSDVGLRGADIDAAAQLFDGSLLLSLDRPFAHPTLGEIDDSDILRFQPSALGETTSGTLSRFVDGSDLGLETNAEDIDALAVLSKDENHVLLLSVRGTLRAQGVIARDEDLVRLELGRTGADTLGTLSLDFDGSALGLNTDNQEDLVGAAVEGNDLLFLTRGAFSATDSSGSIVNGDGGDLVRCAARTVGPTRCRLSVELDNSTTGLGGERLDALFLIPN